MGWDLRVARRDDADELARLHAEINVELDREFAGAGNGLTDQVVAGYQQMWTANLAGESHQTCVAVDDGVIVGFADLDWASDAALPELLGIYVHQRCRRRGVGAALLSWAKEAARPGQAPELQLWTFENNKRAQRFFEQHGGRSTGSRRSPHQGSALAGAGLEFVEYRVPVD